MHLGHSESVERGQPSGGLDFSEDFSSGFSDHFGVGEGFCLILFRLLNTTHAPLAATVTAFSTYFTGLCMRSRFPVLVCRGKLQLYRRFPIRTLSEPAVARFSWAIHPRSTGWRLPPDGLTRPYVIEDMGEARADVNERGKTGV